MAAFSPSTHKLVTSPTQNPKDDLRADARDVLTRLLLDMGLFRVMAGNTPPTNKDDLWWHIDVRQVKRWDAVQGNWFAATPNQIAMHLQRRAVLGAVTDISLEAGDLFTFWDVSLGDVKIISRENLMAALGALRAISTSEGIQGGGTLASDRELKLNISGLIAKPTPSPVDSLALFSASEGLHRKATIAAIASAISASQSGQSFFMSGH